MENLVKVEEKHASISENFGYTEAEVAVIHKTVAKGTSKVELAYFINVCKTVGLNPFIKEIWCYKDNRDNLLVFAGRDGFLTKAQRDIRFNGLRSSEVCKEDNFSIDIANNKIEHTFGLEDRGEIIGAYCVVFRKDGEPTIEFADFKTYNKGYNAWKSHPNEMIKKVAETHALKKAFGISGIQAEYDFTIDKNIAAPINSNKSKYSLEVLVALFDEKRNLLTTEDILNIERIVENMEEASYMKVIIDLEKLT